MKFFNLLHRLQNQGFVLAMIATVCLAALAPRIGTSGGPLHLERWTVVGVSLVFLLSGAGLSTESLKAGMRNWRLHLFVQSSTYVVFPLLGVFITIAAGSALPHDLLVGVFYLCALSSTVSTSIAMTSMARGNIAGAIFNATLSSLLGMLVTPVLMNLWLHTRGQGMPIDEQFLKIAQQLLLPFILGQMLRPWIGTWLLRHKNITGKVDRAAILLIVYNAFCDSTAAGLWSDYGWRTLAQTLLLTAGLLSAVLVITTFATRRFGFSTEDEIAGVFCGSKKSLATGIPMAKLLFGTATPLGLVVLPLMFYHQLQLFVCSYLAQRYAARKGKQS
jgi:sodium/bile acid cotransporter 7